MSPRFAALRRRPPRVVRSSALIAVALGVVGVVVAVPHAHRAAAAEANGFASVQPMSFVDQDPDVANLSLAVSLPVTPADVSYRVDGSVQTTTVHALSSPATVNIPVSELDECGPHDVIVTVKDTYGDPPKPQTVTQTISGVTRLCPSMEVSPSKVKGTDPVTITFPDWNSDGRFDSFGSYPDSAVAEPKKLFVNDVEVGDFGYQVAPTAKTPTLKDGDNEIKVVQDSPSGTVQATAYLSSWNSTWAVSPQGVVAVPAAPITLAVSDSATHCGGTTAQVYLDDQTTPKATITGPVAAGSGFSLPPPSFSDGGYFETAGSGEHSIRVEITEGANCSVVKFAGLDVAPGDPSDPPGNPLDPPGGGFGDNPPPPPPAPTIVRIPFAVLDPLVSVDYSELGQSALPYTQTINLPGFDPDNDVYNNRIPQPKTVLIDDETIGTTTASVWTTPLTPPCGDSVLKVTQPTSFGVATAQTPLRVLCPQVQLSPAVIAKAAQPATVELSGNGFHNSDASIWLTQPYVITLDGTQVGQGDMDAAGTFTNSFVASGLACGPHDVTVTEQPPQGGAQVVGPAAAAAADDPAAPDPDGPLTATTPLTVNCPTDPNRPQPPHQNPGQPPAPTLAVNPRGVIAGMRTSVTGTGFTPGHKITLTWSLPSGKKEAACPGTTATALPDGTVSTLCVVPPHDRLGRRQLTGSDGSRSAHADALIISSSMQPSSRRGGLVIRR